MSRRHQHSRKDKGAVAKSGGPRQEIERLIARGQVKDAFKQAKLCFRQDASAENRELVERTYLLRIKALIAGGMTESGREVAGSFIEFGVTTPEFLEELVLLLPKLGLASKAIAMQDKITSPEAQASLSLQFADRAVLHPEETPASLPELHDEAAKVRSALSALDSGDEARALELLQSIPRGSLMADWRYFVRGLAAFRRTDLEQARANWARLDPQRSAQKIAQILLSTAAPEKSEEHRKQLSALEASLFGEPVLERFNQLRQALEKADWKRRAPAGWPLHLSLRRVDPRWSQRLTEILLKPYAIELARHGHVQAERLAREFAAVLEPLPWDPQWNRFYALCLEGPHGHIEEALRYWRKFLKDLDTCPAMPGVEPRQLQALVWRRIGEMLLNMADDDEGDFPYQDDDWDDSDEDWEKAESELVNEAAEAFQMSLHLDPTQRKTHEELIELHESEDQPERMAAATRRLLVAFPEDVEAMQKLIAFHVQRDEPEQVLGYIQRIRALKPLDTSLFDHEAWARLALARHLALKGSWQEGREEFARFTKLPDNHAKPHQTMARRAAFEFKAGQDAAAEEFIRQAQASLADPAPLWHALAIEAVRYKLPKPLQQRFNQDLKTALAKKVSSATAGALAELMAAYVESKIDYTGRAGHVREIVAYLRRTTRIKYTESDLTNVCLLLTSLQERSLLEKLVNRGRKLFPKSPSFLLMATNIDLSKGPFACDPKRAQKQLEQALALALASQNPLYAQMIPSIKSTLSQVQDICEAMDSMPFGRGRFPGRMPRGFPDFMASMMDQMEDELGPDE